MISICEKKYRIKFGIALKFYPSGEMNLAEDIPHQMLGRVQFDGNQQPKYVTRGNNPRLVQRATCSMYWGANTHIQRLLMSSIGEYLIKCMEKDVFPKFIFYLDLLKARGLEQYSRLNTIIDYITGYTCKGRENPVVWDDTMEDMVDAYIKSGKEGNLRSLVATIMNNVSTQQSVFMSQPAFTLCGGKLKRSSFGFTRVCSVNEVDLENVKEATLPLPSSIEGSTDPIAVISN